MQNSVCLLLVAAAIMMIMMMAPAPYWPVSDPKNKIFFHQKKKKRGENADIDESSSTRWSTDFLSEFVDLFPEKFDDIAG